MDTRLVQRALEHLRAPARLLPRRQIHQLPDLGEHHFPSRLRGGVADCAEDRHLAELVVQRHAQSRGLRRAYHFVRFRDAGHERLLADHVRTAAQRAHAIVVVGSRRGADYDDFGLGFADQLIEIGEYRNAEGPGSTLTTPGIRVARAGDFRAGNAFQRRQVQ